MARELGSESGREVRKSSARRLKSENNSALKVDWLGGDAVERLRGGRG